MSTELSGRNKHILFISLVIIRDLSKRGIYPDLINYFINQGYHVSILSPIERRDKAKAKIIEGKGFTNIRYKTLNNTKTNNVEKLVSTFIIDSLIKRAVKQYLSSPIDILVTATPPITLTTSIKYIKKNFNVKCYLLLKDIFPDNIADLELISRKSILFKFFKSKEKMLYSYCDHIGCMSPANMEYLKRNHPEIPLNKLEVNPNTINPIEIVKSKKLKTNLREKYGVAEGSRVFFYGGNLGKPQMISFLKDLIESNLDNTKVHFFVVGTGTEYPKLEKWLSRKRVVNFTLLSFVPKAEYDQLINIADIGIVLLDNRFVIPNFPNRILSYMENKLPVFLATDVHTDISDLAVANGFGIWAESGNLKDSNKVINRFTSMTDSELDKMGNNGHHCLIQHFHISRTGDLIIDKIQ